MLVRFPISIRFRSGRNVRKRTVTRLFLLSYHLTFLSFPSNCQSTTLPSVISQRNAFGCVHFSLQMRSRRPDDPP